MERIGTDILSSSAGVPTLTAGNIPTLAINGTANVRTHSHSIRSGSAFALVYYATVASGTIDVDLYLEQGPGAPTTEGSIGDSLDGWVTIGAKLVDVTANPTVWASLVLSPQAMPFMRILVDGQGSNPASTLIGLKLTKQELYD